MEIDDVDWKLKLRYGKLSTDLKHFTVLADGVVGNLVGGFTCRPGRAWMAMKTWATDADESASMIRLIGADVGFNVTGKIEVYDTDPDQPPRKNPHGYEIKFTPYDENT